MPRRPLTLVLRALCDLVPVARAPPSISAQKAHGLSSAKASNHPRKRILVFTIVVDRSALKATDLPQTLRPIIGSLLLLLVACATGPKPTLQSPIPLEVVVRLDCRGPRMGRVLPERNLEAALVRALRSSSSSELSSVELLNVELACSNPEVPPSSMTSMQVAGIYGSSSLHAPRSEFTGGRLWLCVAKSGECVPQQYYLSDFQVSGPESVAQFVVGWLNDELSADASLVAPGSNMR